MSRMIRSGVVTPNRVSSSSSSLSHPALTSPSSYDYSSPRPSFSSTAIPSTVIASAAVNSNDHVKQDIILHNDFNQHFETNPSGAIKSYSSAKLLRIANHTFQSFMKAQHQIVMGLTFAMSVALTIFDDKLKVIDNTSRGGQSSEETIEGQQATTLRDDAGESLGNSLPYRELVNILTNDFKQLYSKLCLFYSYGVEGFDHKAWANMGSKDMQVQTVVRDRARLVIQLLHVMADGNVSGFDKLIRLICASQLTIISQISAFLRATDTSIFSALLQLIQCGVEFDQDLNPPSADVITYHCPLTVQDVKEVMSIIRQQNGLDALLQNFDLGGDVFLEDERTDTLAMFNTLCRNVVRNRLIVNKIGHGMLSPGMRLDEASQVALAAATGYDVDDQGSACAILMDEDVDATMGEEAKKGKRGKRSREGSDGSASSSGSSTTVDEDENVSTRRPRTPKHNYQHDIVNTVRMNNKIREQNVEKMKLLTTIDEMRDAQNVDKLEVAKISKLLNDERTKNNHLIAIMKKSETVPSRSNSQGSAMTEQTRRSDLINVSHHSSGSDVVIPSSGPSVARPPPPPAPSVPSLWLSKLELFPIQGRLGITGSAQLTSIRNVPSISAATSIPQSVAVAFKRSFHWNDDVNHEAPRTERRVMEIVASKPHINVMGVIGYAKTLDDFIINDNDICPDRTTEGRAYATELIRGESLQALLTDADTKGRDAVASTELQKLQLCLQFINGAIHLHSIGIHHRDIQPSNVMITGPLVVKLEANDQHVNAATYKQMGGYTPGAAEAYFSHVPPLSGPSDSGHRLVIIDFNSAMHLDYVVRRNMSSECTTEWDRGSMDYSPVTWTREDINGWRPAGGGDGNGDGGKNTLVEEWIRRDNFSIACTMVDILRGVPMVVTRSRSKKQLSNSLSDRFRQYVETALNVNKPVNPDYETRLPSLMGFLMNQTYADDWSHGVGFVQANTKMSNVVNADIKKCLSVMTTCVYKRETDTEEQQHVENGFRKMPFPSTMLASLRTALLKQITILQGSGATFELQMQYKLLDRHNLELVEIDGRGNCLYLAVKYQLKNYQPPSGVDAPTWATAGTPEYDQVNQPHCSTPVSLMRTAAAARIAQMFTNLGTCDKLSPMVQDTVRDDAGKTKIETMIDGLVACPSERQLYQSLLTMKDSNKRKAAIKTIRTDRKWDNDAGDIVAHTLAIMYKVVVVIIGGSPETYSQQDIELGNDSVEAKWPHVFIVRAGNHYSATKSSSSLLTL